MWALSPSYRPLRPGAEHSFCDHVAVAPPALVRLIAAVIALAVVVAGCTDDQTAESPVPQAAATPTPAAEPTTPIPAEPEVREERYGDAASQFGELWLPAGDAPNPIVVLIHGGFWQDAFDLRLMDPLARDLVGRGYAVWNIEYRRVGNDGGGWPTTFDDVAAAIDHLAALGGSAPLDLDQVALVGHSAGGHLALWAAGREAIAPGDPWSDPVVIPALTVGQAPVADLARASAERAGGGAVDLFLGGSVDEVPERYAAATPNADVSGELLIVLGSADSIVLPQWAGGAPGFEAAQVVVNGADHFDVIDPTHPSWDVVLDELARVLDS